MNRIRVIRGSLFIWLLGAVLFGGSLAWFLCAGPQNDDLVYLHEFIGNEPYSVTFNYSEGGAITTLPQLFSSIGKHYLYWTNGRLGSALIFAANLWPFWLTAGISAVALAAMFLLVMRLGLGRGWTRRPLSCMLITLMLWWLLPWHEFMLAQAYTINYVWAGALYLWLLLLLLTGRGRLWAVCVLAFIASTMHEGLSMTLDVVLFCICLRELIRHGWRKRLMLPSIIFAMGSLTVLLSPSVGLRSTGMITYFQMYWRGLLQLLFIFDWIFPTTCLAALIAYRRLPRPLFRSWWGLAGPVLLAAVVTLTTKTMIGGLVLRGLWLSDILLFIVCLRFLRRYRLPGGAGWKRVVAWVLLVSNGVWMSGVAAVQHELTAQMHRVAEKYISSRCPVVYEHTTSPQELPWWTLGIPITFDDSVFPLSFHLYSKYLHDVMPPGTDRRLMQLVVLEPEDSLTAFKDFPLMPGTAGLRKSSGEIFYSDRYLKPNVHYTFGDPEVDGSNGEVGFPWYEFRLRFVPKPVRVQRPCILYMKKVVPTDEMRRRGLVPPDFRDTLYFYQVEHFSIPRITQGLPVISVDTI